MRNVSGAPFFVVVSVCFHGSESLICAETKSLLFHTHVKPHLSFFCFFFSFFVSLSLFLSEKERDRRDLAGADE